ncbi:MAG: VCBS repeat-containing protein [Planctomycetota bacterium]|nr:VCBS repeat-containing protein [Planctomycetota bacterium]
MRCSRGRILALLAMAFCFSYLASCGRHTSNPPSDTTPGAVAEAATSLTPAETSWSLEEPDRVYLWDLEHHSNVLVKYGFGAIVRALQEQDGDAIRGMTAEDFQGQLHDQPTETRFEDATLVAHRERLAATGSKPLTRDELAAFLFDLRQPFASAPKVRFDVKLISPNSPHDLDGEWTATCVMRMWGELGTHAPGERSVLFRLRFGRPTNASMQAPGWIRGWSIEQVASSQASQFLFREVHEEYKLDDQYLYDNWKSAQAVQNSGGIFACDFNRDACIDVLVTDANMLGNALFQGLPEGGFADVTASMNLLGLRNPVPDIDATFVDLDGDGWEDLVFASGRVWRNMAGQSFTEMTTQANLFRTIGASVGQTRARFSSVTSADFNRDGNMDLYLTRSGGTPTSWLQDTRDSPGDNLLLQNLGDWQFADVTHECAVEGGARSTFVSVWLDANNDLWPDLYVINEYGDGALYVNQEGKMFRETDVAAKTDDFGSMGVTCGDIDNDGNIDLYLGSMYSKAGSRVVGNLPAEVYPQDVMSKLRRLISGSEFYQNEGALKFAATGESYQIHDVGWAWGPTMADFNNDGWLDIYATAGYISRDRNKPDG